MPVTTNGNRRSTLTFCWSVSLQATRGLAESITTYAEANNETFPFVTVDIFETLARHSREQSGIESLVYSPIVRDRDRAAWEQYSVDKQGWIQQSIRQFHPSPELVSSEEVTYNDMAPIFPKIYTLSVDSVERTPAESASSYSPYWHVSPFPSTTYFVNSDQLQTPYFDISVFNAATIARGKLKRRSQLAPVLPQTLMCRFLL